MVPICFDRQLKLLSKSNDLNKSWQIYWQKPRQKHDHRFLFKASKATHKGANQSHGTLLRKTWTVVKHVCLCLVTRGRGFDLLRLVPPPVKWQGVTSSCKQDKQRLSGSGDSHKFHKLRFAPHRCACTRTRKQGFMDQRGQNEDEQEGSGGGEGRRASCTQLHGYLEMRRWNSLRYWLKSKILINNKSGLGWGKGNKKKEKNTMRFA